MGLVYLAPIGMQNLFVINTVLTQRKLKIWYTGLIVIFFDISLALVCFFGIGLVMASFAWLKLLILSVGSSLIIWIGINFLKADVKGDDEGRKDLSYGKIILASCAVTWANPQALIDGSIVFGCF